MSTATASIVWFRQDLRVADNPALRHAADRGGPVIPVYIWAPDEEGDWPPGAASKVWLHHSLTALQETLARSGSPLVVRRGPSLGTLRDILRETGADAVYWNRRYEPAAIKRDAAVKSALEDDGVEVESFNSRLLFEPWEIENKSGEPYQVFSPFWGACQQRPEPREPLPAVRKLTPPKKPTTSVDLDDLKLLPKIDWHAKIADAWELGETAAQRRLRTFLQESAADYEVRRSFPAAGATSRLSPHLHFGEISPRTVWHETMAAIVEAPAMEKSVTTFLKELGWREFAYHLLYHFPHTTNENLRPEFNRFPWSRSKINLEAWQKGRTGYPMVDAGMRQLWQTGWMHNRARMVVASFLTKHLRIHWLEGARWFWDTLVDADLANNTLGWQWSAGTGADAAPYFRIFNPALQADKFDPEGEYIRCWVSEPEDAYPAPIVDHGAAREAALQAYERVKGR